MYDAVKFTPALARSYFHLVTAQDTKNLKVNLEVSCLKFSIAPLVSCTDMNNSLYMSCILLKA